MDHLRGGEAPPLRAPVLIVAFGGWNDAAQVATGAVRHLIESWRAPQFAEIDPEEFFDFTETRPRVRLVDGAQRALEWPANAFHYHASPQADHDWLLLLGTEPQLRWRTFTHLIAQVAEERQVAAVLMLGALLADVPHSRPPLLSGTASTPELTSKLQALGVPRSRYEGPTGIVGVLNDACSLHAIPVASLWAHVPHYIAAAPNPRMTAALLRGIGELFGLQVNLQELDLKATQLDAQIAEAIRGSPEIADYVRQLESNAEPESEEHARPTAEESTRPPELPSGEALVKELEDFLRRRRTDDDS